MTKAKKYGIDKVKLRISVLENKYREIVELWKDEDDDRRVAYNMYRQLHKAYEAMKDVDDNFCWCAVIKMANEQKEIMDEIITRFTGLTYQNYQWQKEVQEHE